MRLLSPKTSRRLLGLILLATTILAVTLSRPWWEIRYRIHAAKKSLANREPRDALRHLTLAEQLGPDNSEVHFWLGRTYRRLGEMTFVHQHLERAWKLGFPRDRIQREEWLALAQTGQLRQAEPHLAELLMNPAEDGTEICEAYINGYSLAYRFESALGLLDVWQKDYPQDAQPHYIRGLFFAHSSSESEAVAAFREARRLAPHRKDIRSHLAQFLVTIHEYKEAEELLLDLLRDDPHNFELLSGLGYCLVERGEFERGRHAFEQALLRRSDFVPARLALAQLDIQQGDAEKALERLNPLLEERPYDYKGRFAMGTALQAVGRSAEAKGHFEFVDKAQHALARVANLKDTARASPKDAEVRYEIGMILLEFESPADGAGWLRSVLDLQPDHVPTHKALAEFHRRQGNTTLAEQHARRAKPPEDE